MVDLDGIFIRGLIEIALDRRALPFLRAGGDDEILIVVSPLLEQHRLLVAPGGVVVDHPREGVEAALRQVAVDEDVLALKFGHLKREMGHDVVGLGVGARGGGFADEKAPVLGAVVAVGGEGAWGVGVEPHVVNRRLKGDGLDSHPGIIGRDGLETTVFVAGAEYQRAEMLVDDPVAEHALGRGEDHFVVGPSVLAHDKGEVVEGVGDTADMAQVDPDAQLLVTAVGVDVGERADSGRDHGGKVGDSEARLEQSLVGIALVVDTQEVVAGLRDADFAVRDGDGVVDVVDERGARIFVVLDDAFVEAVEKFRGHKPFRAPAGIAMHELVAHEAAVLGDFVEGDRQAAAVVAEHDDGRGEVVAAECDFQRAERRLEYPLARVGRLSPEGEGDEKRGEQTAQNSPKIHRPQADGGGFRRRR